MTKHLPINLEPASRACILIVSSTAILLVPSTGTLARSKTSKTSNTDTLLVVRTGVGSITGTQSCTAVDTTVPVEIRGRDP